MDSKKVFGAVRNVALASLVVGGLVVAGGCKGSGDSSCGAKAGEKAGDKHCGGEKHCSAEKSCGADKGCGQNSCGSAK